MKANVALRAAMVGLALSVGLGVATSATVTVAGVDLTDLVSGQDLRENTYTFAGALDAGGGFTLLFDPARFADLNVVTSPGGLDLLLTQPDPGFPADGLVTLTAQSAQPGSYVASIVVDFVMLSGSPTAPQHFEVFDANFDIVGSGESRAPVIPGLPEPSSIALVAVAGLALRRSRAAVLRP